MYINEVIIEGFKSYASKTTLSGFDTSFNAITGLNGTGKSNILDAICFVLGISNLTQVRVAKLQELIYKNGQAGVTKANVTIIFNNQDKKQSPVGYDDYSQITVTRSVNIFVNQGGNRWKK
jgi:structural maintenance of chromosome 2